MPSSKVWRKGRWFWCCTEENKSNNWKDHWACGAMSRVTYTTEEEATRAGKHHEYKTGHSTSAQRIIKNDS